MAQDRPRWPQVGPRWPQDGPRWAQHGTRRPQDGPKTGQDGPMTAKMAPRWPNTCYISSAILEICLQALRLATLSALPVPMLRQVYVGPSRGLKNGDSARDVLKKRPHGDVNSMLLRGLRLKRPSWGHLGPSWAVLGPSWGYLGPSWGDIGAILAIFRG